MMAMKGRRQRYEVRQHDERDCAAACMSSVCSYYGRHLPIAEIRDYCGTSMNGTNLQGIVDAGRRLGLDVNAMKALNKRWEILSGIQCPAIVHMEKNGGWLHFVVLYRWKASGAVIMDPAEGKLLTVPADSFMREWSGYVAVLSPSADFVKEDRSTRIWERFRYVLRLCRRELVLASAGAVVYILTGLSASVFIQQLVDVAIPGRNMSMLMVFGVAMLLMTVCSFVIGYVRTLLTVKAGLKTDAGLVSSYLGKLMTLPVSFFANRSIGELNSRIKDVYRIRNFLTVRLMVIIICVLTLVAALVLMFAFNWRMAAVAMAYVPVYALLYFLSESVCRRVNRSVIESGAAFDSESVEVLSGIRTVRLNGWEDTFLERLVNKYERFVSDSWKGGRYLAGFAVASDGAARMLAYAVLVLGTVLVFRDDLTAGELMSFYTMTSFFTAPVNSLIESNNDIAQATVAAERLFEILDMDSEKCDGEEEPRGGGGHIRIENLYFSYPGRKPLFKGLSIDFPRGVITAVRGGNGSGKSTLAMMILRACTPDAGNITLDGRDIRSFRLESWRRYVSLVPQKAELFNGTILENIVPGENEPDVQRVASLCVSVGLGETLERMPYGIQSEVGEGGCRLSGGERQKVAMVRALYRDSRIIILDEATASMDDRSRKRTVEILKTLAGRGRTIIMITHDDVCLTAADRIVDVE